jgi:hypothetical protein
VSETQWFEPAIRAELSQGDIFDGLPFCTPELPVVHLSPGTGRGAKPIWTPSDPATSFRPDQKNRALVAYRMGHGIVVSHDCAIDKPKRNGRILFAPVVSIAVLDTLTQDVVRRQGHFSSMYLPGLPGLGDAYADLRLITPFPRDIVDELRQVASLTDAARTRLHQAIVAFFVRLNLSARP